MRQKSKTQVTSSEQVVKDISKEFLEAGKRRLAVDTERSASTGEVKKLRREVRDMKDLLPISRWKTACSKKA